MIGRLPSNPSHPGLIRSPWQRAFTNICPSSPNVEPYFALTRQPWTSVTKSLIPLSTLSFKRMYPRSSRNSGRIDSSAIFLATGDATATWKPRKIARDRRQHPVTVMPSAPGVSHHSLPHRARSLSHNLMPPHPPPLRSSLQGLGCPHFAGVPKQPIPQPHPLTLCLRSRDPRCLDLPRALFPLRLPVWAPRPDTARLLKTSIILSSGRFRHHRQKSPVHAHHRLP
jgi:hypothetical protein